MAMRILKTAVACALSAALVASQISPAAAGPMPTNVATMKSMVADGPIQVYWRGRGWGIGAGLLAGAVIGGAIANSNYGYYGSPYYGGYGYSYPSYGYAYPSYGYASPSYGYPSYGYAYPHVAHYYGHRHYYGGYNAYGYYRPHHVYYRHHYRHW
jgi:hypothetical protein